MGSEEDRANETHCRSKGRACNRARNHLLVDECDAILLEPATELDHNRVLEATLVYLEKLDKAQMIALAKRDMALRQLEWYREGLGRRLREVSENFITDQANAAAAASAQTEASTQAAVEAPAVQPQ